MDGVAENFHTEQNRDLLEKLAAQTGRALLAARRISASWPSEISYSEAGITVRETKELWDYADRVPADSAAARSAEWLLRRRWGIV